MMENDVENMITNVYDWLLERADLPIRYNILRFRDDTSAGELEAMLLGSPEVQYWLHHLRFYYERSRVDKLHGSHDYRYENIMGKLAQLGMHADIGCFADYASLYLRFLNRQIETHRDAKLTFDKLYSYHDNELLLAAYLALTGYTDDPAVRHVIDERVSLLYDSTRQHRYDIYVDGSKYPGVPKNWQTRLINPDLYADGRIRLPTLHDYILLSTVSQKSIDNETQAKIDTIVGWLFDDAYNDIKDNYGYFYAPASPYPSKSICRKLDLPRIADGNESQCLILTVYILSHFTMSMSSSWYREAFTYLEQYKTPCNTYILPRKMLTEKRDHYWTSGGHMGMGENRRSRTWIELESTYWMARIKSISAESKR